MNTVRRTIATIELLLIFPGALFMTALFVRNIQPPPYEPAQAARDLVDWFATHTVLALYIFLMVLPFTALITGSAIILRAWRTDAQLRQAAVTTVAAVRAHLAAVLIAVATLAAAGILAIVAVHMITD
jgi:hypothetical protein